MEKVFKSLSLVALLSISATTQAALIEVKYSGFVDEIIDSNTRKYKIGDAISGSLFIDTDEAPGEYYAAFGGGAPGEAFYGNGFGLGGSNGFVTGFAPTQTFSEDWVYLLDDTGGVGDDFQVGEDEYSYYDNGNGNYGGTDYFFYVGLSAPTALDFIDGTGLEQSFNLTSADASLEGYLFKNRYKFVNDVEIFDKYEIISFSLDSLKVSSVPEPGSLALLSLGVAGLLSRRRLKA